MRKRGHKSTKVPNVRLRPALAGAFSRDVVRVQDSQLDSDDTIYHDPTPRPFTGVVLCATGIADKPGIFKQAIELGALTTNDFTDRVTHLIAKQHGGAKYMCALENKIPILQPSWVTQSYQIWLHGDDVDFAQSIEQHRLPIFSDVVLCISGIPDIARRNEINKLVTSHGGTYVKVLERPVRVTHLLCSGDEERDKMYYAEKFNKQGEADIKLVWEEWLWDSLEFGGRFDEDRYEARQPRPKPRKANAPSITPNNQNEAPPGEQPRVTFDIPPVAIEQVDDEPVQASVRKPVGFQRELWRSVLAPRGYEWNEESTVLVKSPTKVQRPQVPVEEFEDDENAAQRKKSVLSSSSFRRANSFAPLPTKQPLRRLLSTRMKSVPTGDDEGLEGVEVDSPGAGPSTRKGVVPAGSVANIAPHPPTPSIFSGLRFTALGEADCENVRQAISKAGGIINETDNLSDGAHQVDIIIVRLVSGSKIFAESPLDVRHKFRTECWLEKCLFDGRLCPPESHISFTPVGAPCPISGANKVHISFSGFDQAEKFFMTRLMKVLGVELLSNFTKRATHLLCPSAEGLKFEKAQEWGVPVVGMAWVEEMKQSGLVPVAKKYLVTSTLQPPKHDANDPKGKRKATDSDLGMMDITNRVDSQSQTQEDSQSVEFEQPAPLKTLPPLQEDHRPQITPVPSLTKLTLHENVGFGKPTSLLALRPSPPPPNEEQVTSSITDPETVPEPKEKSISAQTSLTSIDAPGPLGGSDLDYNTTTTGAKLTTVAAGAEPAAMLVDEEPVPSSNTPSPIKPIKKGKGRTLARTKSASLSPSKYYPPVKPIDSETTKALHESLTSLLGKRRSDESGEGSRDGSTSRGDRIDGKRPRAMRSKSKAATTEKQKLVQESFGSFEVAYGDDDPFGFGRANEIVLEGDPHQEESMRVTYEDPEQHAEKRKLMKLLQSDSQEERPKARVAKGKEKVSAVSSSSGSSLARRRSTRKSGG